MALDVAFPLSKIIVNKKATNRKSAPQMGSEKKETFRIDITARSNYTNNKTVRPNRQSSKLKFMRFRHE